MITDLIMIQPKLTIVIPCKNEGMGIIECLTHLERQSVLTNVIIADSSDITYHRAGLLRWCEGKDWIRIIPGGLPGPARNAGGRITQTEYILFLDADIMLRHTDTIERCLEDIKDADLITVRMRSTEPGWNPVWWVFQVVQTVLSKKHPFALGGFQMWRRDTFLKLGGFDARVKVGEDWMLSRKCRPDRFRVLPVSVFTSARRFRNWGLIKMVGLLIGGWVNRNKPEWFYKSHNYWK